MSMAMATSMPHHPEWIPNAWRRREGAALGSLGCLLLGFGGLGYARYRYKLQLRFFALVEEESVTTATGANTGANVPTPSPSPSPPYESFKV